MTQPSAPAGNNRFAFWSVTSLFFLWGFITCMNDLLIPKLKVGFDLSQTQANLVQFAFFGAYFVISLVYYLISAVAGDPISKIGYKKGVVLGLLICGAGCLLFYPAATTLKYPLFLGALFILGTGVTILQIAANPFVSILGPEESAPSRLNLAQGMRSLGDVVAPLIGGILLFGSSVYQTSGGVDAVKTPYLGLGLIFIALALVFSRIPLPSFVQEAATSTKVSAFKHRHFIWGWLAIFFYVGSEVTVGSIMINYLKVVLSLPEDHVTHFLSFYWGGLLIGRLMGAISLGSSTGSRKFGYMVAAAAAATAVIFANATFKEKLTHGNFIPFGDILPYIGLIVLTFVFFYLGQSKPGRMIGLFSLVAALLTISAMSSMGQVALWSIVGIGLFNSIMWSNIFTMAIRGLGPARSQGSSLLVMMIVGGALMPLVQGTLMDHLHSVHQSLAIVVVGYAYLAFFGFFGSKSNVPLSEAEADETMVGGH